MAGMIQFDERHQRIKSFAVFPDIYPSFLQRNSATARALEPAMGLNAGSPGASHVTLGK